MIAINQKIYQQLAQQLLEKITDTNYFNGTIELDVEDVYTTLRATFIIYRKGYAEPTGEVERVVDVVPVWWEYTTVGQRGEEENDFDWCEFKNYIIN